MRRPRLVVLDFEMPRLDGLGVLEELRAQMRTAGLPVIMLTSHAGETEEKALDLGAQTLAGHWPESCPFAGSKFALSGAP
jgi:CheY-like chemotaxis protein